MNILEFATNPDAEGDGVWVDAGGGLRLRLCRAKNARFKELAMKVMKPHMRMLQAGKLSVKEIEDLDKRVVAKTIIRGWQNMQDEDGNDIPYSQTKALELLREHPEFYEYVQDLASDAATFHVEVEEATAENSETP